MKVLVSVLLSLISFAACQTCDKSILDISLVIDSSASIGAANFALEKSAVAEMIKQLNTNGPQKIKVGVINYSTVPNSLTLLVDTDQDKAIMVAKVNNMQYLNGSTSTDLALMFARQTFFNYPCEYSPRVLVLFTNGQSNTGANVITQADLLKNQQDVSIFTVGIGSVINHAELNAVSSKPITTYKKIFANYPDLYAAINEITQAACRTSAFIPGKTVLV